MLHSSVLRTYGMLVDELGNDTHLLALISARDAEMDEIVTKDFYDVLKEKGYEVD